MAYCAHCGSYLPAVSFAPCASCGKPGNGAPPRPPGSGLSVAVIVITVAAGAFFVLVMIGVVASVALPNLLTSLERARQKRTMADMRTIAVAVEEYAKDHGGAYPAGTRVRDLQTTLVPTYTRVLPVADGWDRDFWYTHTDAQYVLTSLGQDGQADRNVDLTSPLATQNFGRDIILVNGKFMQYPEGLE